MDTGVVVAITAVLVVLATSLFKNANFSATVKNTIAAVLSVVGGVVTVWSTGGFDGASDVLKTALLVYGAAQLIYQFLFNADSAVGIFKGVDSTLEGVKVLPGGDDAGG